MHYPIGFPSSLYCLFTYLLSSLFEFILVYTLLSFLLQVLWLESLPALYFISFSIILFQFLLYWLI